MSQWYVKDLSDLTGVSVQTLHHYDRIDLLKPSVRLPNGYRIYSEKDLLRLQQIIALKYFGFELAQIASLLNDGMDAYEHLRAQAEFLRKKASGLLKAYEHLDRLLLAGEPNQSVPWETIIEWIEVYRMTERLEQTWAADVFTPEELKQYAKFSSELKTRYTEAQKSQFEQEWAKVVAEIRVHLHDDPASEVGVTLAKKVMDLVNDLYGKDHANLKHQIWEKGFKQGKVTEDHLFTPEIVAWLDKANHAYYSDRIMAILDKVGTDSAAVSAKKWHELTTEMHGDDAELKRGLIEVVLKDDRLSEPARRWLKRLP